MSFFSPGAGRGYFWSGLSNALENIYKINRKNEIDEERYSLMKDRDKFLNDLMKERIASEYGYKKELKEKEFDYKKELQKLKDRVENAKLENDYIDSLIQVNKLKSSMANDNKLIKSPEYLDLYNSANEIQEFVIRKIRGGDNIKNTNLQNVMPKQVKQQIKQEPIKTESLPKQINKQKEVFES